MKTSKLSRSVGNIPPSHLSGYFDDTAVFSPDTIFQLIAKVCTDVNSAYSARVLWHLKYEDIDGLLELDVHPSDYSDATSYLKDAQIFALVKKFPAWQSSHNPEQTAKKIFLSCEASCRETNRRFWTHEPCSWAVHSVLALAQRSISNILREAPDVEDLSFRFGPGASYGVKYNTSALDKLASNADVTKSCHELARRFLRTCPGWKSNDDTDIVGPLQPLPLREVKGDRLSFVPKTAKTHRPIGINPLLNGVIQKGIGAVIRRRLRPILDLDTLQSKHREIARQASKSNYLSTIDLKSASDTIAFAVVQSLLSGPWFDLLYACRSSQYEIEGNWYPYQKFSAMGNGYTFELETLLFYSLASACAEHLGIGSIDVSVYGDDVIIPTQCVPLFREVLTYCGFEVNVEKSFTDGPFRESCGGDYYNGTDVRPFFLKDGISFRTLFLLHNYLVRTGNRFLFPKTYAFVRNLIGKESMVFFRTWDYLDDFALLDESMPVTSYNRLVPHEKGVRRSQKVRAYGVAYGLYRLMSRYETDSESQLPWYKLRGYRILYGLHRHVHI